jgi:putative endonuclease
MWYVYIVRCSNKTLYAGTTDNIERRIKEHNSGKGAKYTRSLAPVKLLWTEEHSNKSAALKREIQIKKWTRSKKEALISGNFELLKDL